MSTDFIWSSDMSHETIFLSSHKHQISIWAVCGWVLGYILARKGCSKRNNGEPTIHFQMHIHFLVWNQIPHCNTREKKITRLAHMHNCSLILVKIASWVFVIFNGSRAFSDTTWNDIHVPYNEQLQLKRRCREALVPYVHEYFCLKNYSRTNKRRYSFFSIYLYLMTPLLRICNMEWKRMLCSLFHNDACSSLAVSFPSSFVSLLQNISYCT